MGKMSLLLKLAVVVVLVAVGWRWTRPPQLPAVTEGFFLPQYRPVAELFRKYVADGTERGGSFAVFHKGERLIDLWGGYADRESHRPWREDTVSLAWSSTKGVCSITIAKLVERGLLDYKAELRQYWPEFAQNGKGNITLEMLLSMQAGLVSLGGKTFTLHEYKNDWPKVEKIMAEAVPDYPPGSRLVYHAFTFAMYLDALVRRVDPQHRNMSQFFQEEIAKPYGIDFHIGLPLDQYYRAARQVYATPWDQLSLVLYPADRLLLWYMIAKPNSVFSKGITVLEGFAGKPGMFNDPLMMEVGVGSMMGAGSARSLAKLYDRVVSGVSAGGQALLPQPIVDSLSVEVNPSVLQEPKISSYSRGFRLTTNVLGDVMFGHPGYGGQIARADPKNQLGISYITNFHWSKAITAPDHYQELERVFYECFHKQKASKK